MKLFFTQYVAIVCAILSLITTACGRQSIITPTFTATIAPTFTETPTPSPTLTPIPTPTSVSLIVNGQSFPFSNTELGITNTTNIRQISELGFGDPLFMTYSPDDSLLALVTAGGWIRIFSVRDKAEIQRIDSNLPLNLEALNWGNKCNACAGLGISPDNKLIAAASVDGTVGVWEISSGVRSFLFPSKQFDEPWRNIYHQIYLTFISNSMIGLAHDGIVRALYNLDKRIVTEPGYPHLAWAWGHVSSNNLHYTVGLLYGSIVNNHTTDWQTWEQTRLKASSSNPVSLSPDGNFVLVQSLQVWNIPEASVFTLTAPIRIGPLERISSYYGLFSDKSDILVAHIGYGNTNLQYVFDPPTMAVIEVWDTNLAKQLFTLQLPRPKNNAFALSHSGTSFAYIDPSQTIIILDPKTGKEQITIDLGDTCLNSSTIITPDGSRFINYFGNIIHICDSKTGDLLNSITVPTMLIMDIAISPDSKLLASSGYSNRRLENLSNIYDTNVYIWEIASGSLVQTMKGHTGNVSSVAFSNTGDILAGGGGTNPAKICIERGTEGKVIFWSVTDGSIIGKTQSLPGGVSSFTFMEDDNSYVLGVDGCSKAGVWEGSINKGLILQNLDSQGGSVKYNSHDGIVLVDNGSTKGYDQNTGELLYLISAAHNIALNSDNTIIVGMAEEGKIGFWNARNGNLLYSLSVKHNYENFLFSPDRKYILGLGIEGTTLWTIK